MTVSKCPCLTFSAAMSCLDAKISLVPKHKLVVPSSYLPLQHTSEQTRPQSRKATQPKIHTLRPLTYELFFQKRSKIERVVLNRECIEGIFCTNWVRIQTLSDSLIPKYWSGAEMTLFTILKTEKPLGRGETFGTRKIT